MAIARRIPSIAGFVAPTGGAVISPTGIASAEAFGTATLTTGAVTVSPTSIASAEAFGTPVVTAVAVTVSPTGILSAEAFGTGTVTTGVVTVSPTGIASAEAFGAPVVTAGAVLTIIPTGIASAEVFGTAVITTGVVTVTPTGVASAESFGSASAIPGPVTVSPVAIASEEAFGTAALSQSAPILLPSGILSAEAFGTASILTGAVSIGVAGIASAEAFGTAIVENVGVTITLLELVRNDLLAAFRSEDVADQAGVSLTRWSSEKLPYVTYGGDQQPGHMNFGRLPHVSFWVNNYSLDSLAADGGAARFNVTIKVTVSNNTAFDAEVAGHRLLSSCIKAIRQDDGEDEGNTSRTNITHGELGWEIDTNFECVRTFQKSRQGIIVT